MESIDRLEVAQAVLRAPLRVTKASEQTFSPGWRTPDEVIVTHRCILILRGKLEYTVENCRRICVAGEVLWVPAWCRRQWRVAGRASCALLWCELAMEPVSLPSLLHVVGRAEDGLEEGLRRMLAGWPPEGRAGALRLEAEAKALAVRFWSAAEATEAGETVKPATHPEVRRARVWLESNYARPDALEAFYGELTLSPNHFRLLFRRETGETVQAMLARLRLRRARYLVRETTWPMKRIAAETGFADPLYFSSCYRDFWGSAPTADREEGGAA